jgi:FkbM family methyltransferase
MPQMVTKAQLKELIKGLTPPFIWKSLQSLKYGNRTYKGMNQLDKKLEAYVDFDNGYFVELGANDGITQSNTYYFERNRGWTGVLIEPIPHNFLNCHKIRAPRTKIFCNACTSFDYTDKFVEICFSNLMSTAIGLESDIKNPIEHAKAGKQFLNETEPNFTFGALAVPLNSILQTAEAPTRIDFLSLDVEGAEIDVLKGVDHSKYRFSYICVESRSKDKIAKYLAEHGYSLVEQLSGWDYLFKDTKSKIA